MRGEHAHSNVVGMFGGVLGAGAGRCGSAVQYDAEPDGTGQGDKRRRRALRDHERHWERSRQF